MKNLNLFTGLHRYSLDDLDHMSEGYTEAITSLSKAIVNITDPVILHGCVVTQVGQDYTVTAGAIYYDGEIYQVAAHALNSATAPNWAIDTTYRANNPVVYADSASHNVHEIKTMKIQVASGVTQWNQIRRIEWVLRNKLCTIGEVKLFAVALSDFTSGLGDTYKQWENWAIMDGTNGTIDMGGFFPVGMKAGDADYDVVGDTGGSKTVSLSVDQGPRHKHGIKTEGEGVAGDGVRGRTSDVLTGVTEFTELSGGDTGLAVEGPGLPHENRPPFKALRFIQKIA
jgi:hypothetical protein